MRIRRLIIPAIVILSLAVLAGAGATAGLMANNAQAESPPPEAPEVAVAPPAGPVPAAARSVQPGPESSVAINQQPQVSDSGEYPIPEKAELTYPHLGSRLDRLVVRVEAREISAEEAAQETAMHQGDSVAVTIRLSGNVDVVAAFLEENGGSPRNVGEEYIEAYVPVTLMGELSGQSGVLRVREILPPQPGNAP